MFQAPDYDAWSVADRDVAKMRVGGSSTAADHVMHVLMAPHKNVMAFVRLFDLLDSILDTMVIGLLALTSIPTITGVGNAVSAQKRQNASSKEQEKFHLTAMLPMEGELREAAFVVLVDGKVNHPSSMTSHRLSRASTR